MQMNEKKYNFIVSDYRKLWIEGATSLYIVEPYVYYRLEKTGDILDYDEIIVAPYRRKTSSDLEKDHNFVQLKFDKYINILSERLNQIHGTNYNMQFWRKTLSISFERYITFFHEIFENCELYFKADRHDCNVLSDKSYHIPWDFEEQRNFFQNSNYGQEQMFSIYMHTFYPDELKTRDDYQFRTPNMQRSSKKPFIVRVLKRGFSRDSFERAKEILLKIFYSRKPHKIGILGSFFSKRYLNFLMFKSKGLIYPLKWSIALKANDNLSWESRNLLCENQEDFDKFDRFFFASLKYCFPKTFIEYFKEIETYYNNYFSKYKDLEFVTSEAWLSDNYLCVALALLKERGVKHIYNEHNYFEHPWVGSLISKEASLSDIFVSMGWYSNKIPNMIKGASLFEFKLHKIPKKRYKICFISSGATAKRTNYTASYGWTCENAPKYFKFVELFLGSLKYQTRREILYRGYPLPSIEGLLSYDQDYMLHPYIKHMHSHNDISVPGKLIMLQSNFVIVDYISTVYIEALIMNIPMIFFWNPDACYLNNDNSDFFDALISVGICQTDPVKAAYFVESIKDYPEKWWKQEVVQKAKDDFLRKNIGKPEVMINYLLGLLKLDKNLTPSHN